MKTRFLSVLLISAIFVGCAANSPLDLSSSGVLPEVSELGESLVENGQFAGVLLAVLKEGQLAHYSEHGTYGMVDERPLSRDTLFRIYSMTKPITALAAMMLWEEGRFNLDDPIEKYLPEFADRVVLQDDGEQIAANGSITIKQLLTHSAGFTYGFAPDSPADKVYFEAQVFNAKSQDDFVSRLTALPLKYQPGTHYRYSVSIDIIGLLVERLSGQRLGEFMQQRIFMPLAMTDTFFEVPQDKLERLAGDHFWDRQNEVMVAIPPEQQRNFGDVGFDFGGGGLVSSLDDYLRFCQFVLNRGALDGVRLVEPETIDLMLQDQLEGSVRNRAGGYPDINLYDGQSMGFGFAVIYDESQLPPEYQTGEASWGGLAGTQFWINPAEQTAGVGMVQLIGQPWAFDALFRVAAQQGLDALGE